MRMMKIRMVCDVQYSLGPKGMSYARTAEDWYTNDYPDEEDSSEESRSSDDFYDDSDDAEYVAADDSDHDWR